MWKCALAVTILTACTADAPIATAPHAERLVRPRAGELVGAGANATERARDLVAQLAPRWFGAALPELEARGEIAVPGGRVVRLQQIIDGLPVEAGELHVLARDGGELVAASGVPASADLLRAPARFVVDEAGAIARAAGAGAPTRSRARRVWHRDGDRLIAAWLVEVFTADGDAQRVVLAGDDGRELARRSLVDRDQVAYRVYADTTPEIHPDDGPLLDYTPHPRGVPDGTYPVLGAPVAVAVAGLNHPTGGGTDPWLPAGGTVTTGNNLDAYTDAVAPDGFSAGDVRGTMTVANTFDRTYDFTLAPMASVEQQRVGVTALFFTINWLHDFWYDAGFVEAAGNAQTSNYGRGGLEGDPLLGETQDAALAGSRNNANMSTPDDGMSPRMQVYLWGGKEDRELIVRPPGSRLAVGSARFGLTNFDTSGPLVAAADGTAPATDACQAIGNSLGTIVLVDRGTCSYKTKVANAQNAGAIGVVVINNTTAASPPSMGDDATITEPIAIPVLSITQADGQALRARLAAGPLTVELARHVAPDLDGALDASVIAHEHGHYLHHRLSQCNTQMCGAMSEGWADFSALMMVLRAGDDLDGAFPLAQYATQSFSGDPAYYGIRREPYSASFAIDPLTFIDMAEGQALPTTAPILGSGNNSEVHNAGEIWATTLFEAYVALQKAHADFTATRALMARYIVGGLLLAPPDATPTEMRDAILAAIAAASPSDADVVAAGFARRGMGSCAVSPPRDSTDFTGIVESTGLSGNPVLGPATFAIANKCDTDLVLDANETATVSVPFANLGYLPLSNVTFEVSTPTPGVGILATILGDNGTQTLATLAPGEHHDLALALTYFGDTGVPVAGELDIKVTATNGCGPAVMTAIPFRVNVDDVSNSSSDDHFDTDDTPWVTTDAAAWLHVRESALDGAWHGPNLGRQSDASLVSPTLDVATDRDFTIAFTHRFAFEFSSATAWDGGVVEISNDNGATWVDVATFADPGYNVTITDQAKNPLAKRAAFGNQNPSFPATDVVTIPFGRAFAGQAVRVRFRIGSDANTGAPGWDLDDLVVTGITNTPFPSQVVDPGTCDAGVIVGQGGGCCDSSGLPAGNLAIGLAILGIGRRRRRS